ncbi:hypothetical protein [Flavobacterium sp. UBA7682]|uniref:hypothetical protein n=1 Tax=Flavobacterium sp. UBA7682 TaxID=1946560 RepID=UPI0025C10245|nr:hypothetical protein [Flavobacterium sp. UBA7682]
MRKFCVFCGEKPVDKNKEHIIPQWLIKYTGNPKRITLLGKKEGKEIKFSWLNFVFPACEECNSNFGKIENKIQTILIKIDNEKSVTHNEINLFLDWLDKIRIGMWLGHALLQNKDFEPNFFINDRVASKDRLCLIYKLNDSEQGIGIIGTDTPVFQQTPSCFSIIINNMIFFNYSKEFLLSKNLGFPYPDKYTYDSSSQVKINKFAQGTYKVTFPIIDGKIIKPTVKLYQSILKGSHTLKKPFAGRGRKYCDSNCLYYNNNIIQSRIYLSDEQIDFHGFWPQKKLINFKFKEKFERELLFRAIVQMTLAHQNHSLLETLNKFDEKMETEEKIIFDKYHKEILELNNKKIFEIEKVMKEFYLII